VLIESFISDRRTKEVVPPKRSTTAEVDEPFEMPEPRQQIWRYMGYDKFADLVESRKLYCRRLDKLPDALEGLLSTGNFWQKTSVTQALHNAYNIKLNNDQAIVQSALKRLNYFVNCWHINDAESRTMWRLYAPASDSVVVLSTAQVLNAYSNLCWCSGHSWAITSKVKYVASEAPRPDWLSWGPALFKDLTYRFEREIRIVVTPLERISADCDSFKIPEDSRLLIEKVILHPHASSGFGRSVTQLMRKHLPQVPIVESRIGSRLW
jgi:hypothetical protein